MLGGRLCEFQPSRVGFLTHDFHDGIGSLWLGKIAEILTQSLSQRLVAQELDERGSQGVGGGRGGFGHEGGGVVGEQAGVETLVVVSRGRERNQEGRQSRAREFGQRGGSRSRDDAGGATVLLGHVAKEGLHVGRQRQRGITLTNRVEIGRSGLMHDAPTGEFGLHRRKRIEHGGVERCCALAAAKNE